MAGNIILDRILPEVSDLRREAFRPITLDPGQELTLAGTVPQHVYFLRTGIAQGFVDVGDQEAGGALLGRDSVVGETAGLGFFPASATTVMLTFGEGHRVLAPILFAMAEEMPGVRSILTRAVCSALRAAQKDAARVHRLSKVGYLAHLLLRASDLLESTTVPLTHEVLARSICSHRPHVTVTLQALEQNGLVRAARGRIEIRDRRGLSAVADGRTPIKVREAA